MPLSQATKTRCTHLAMVEQTLAQPFGHIGLLPDSVLQQARTEIGRATATSGSAEVEPLRKAIETRLAQQALQRLLNGRRPGS